MVVLTTATALVISTMVFIEQPLWPNHAARMEAYLGGKSWDTTEQCGVTCGSDEQSGYRFQVVIHA